VISITAVSLFYSWPARPRDPSRVCKTTSTARKNLRILLVGPSESPAAPPWDRAYPQSAHGVLYSTIETTSRPIPIPKHRPAFVSDTPGFALCLPRAPIGSRRPGRLQGRLGNRLVRRALEAATAHGAAPPRLLCQGSGLQLFCAVSEERSHLGSVSLEMPLSQIRQSLQSVMPNSAEFLSSTRRVRFCSSDSQILSQPAWQDFAARVQQREVGVSNWRPRTDRPWPRPAGYRTPWGWNLGPHQVAFTRQSAHRMVLARSGAGPGDHRGGLDVTRC